jgi:hypothetical protein
MCELTAEQQSQLDELLAIDPAVASGLHPLLHSDYGVRARELALCCLSRRLASGSPMRPAVLLALADAMRSARGDYDDA